eukprot:scaffold122812_cov59-Cyclotella_meneghiniana.AAC.1
MSYCLRAQNLRTGAPPAKSFGIMPPSRYLSNNDLVNKDTSTSRSSGIVYPPRCQTHRQGAYYKSYTYHISHRLLIVNGEEFSSKRIKSVKHVQQRQLLPPSPPHLSALRAICIPHLSDSSNFLRHPLLSPVSLRQAVSKK